jgi:hypothetical protein
MVTGTEKYYRARAQEYDQIYEKPERYYWTAVCTLGRQR